MNKIKFALRIIFCPLVFFLWVGAMTLFLGPLCLMLGIGNLSGYLFRNPSEHDDIKEDLMFTFAWIIFPILGTRNFLLTGSIDID
jgi:hypothetical protein